MPGRAFTYDSWRCQQWAVGVPIAPIEISLSRNRIAVVPQPSCCAHNCGQTIVYLICVSWQNN